MRNIVKKETKTISIIFFHFYKIYSQTEVHAPAKKGVPIRELLFLQANF
jgi:hypothetical protein